MDDREGRQQLLEENRRLRDISARQASELQAATNQRLLEQLLFILIQNSLQAADPQRESTITIREVLRNHHVELQISDNCGGIRPDIVDRVFDPFFTTKSQDLGTGLGLCIAERIVTDMRGRIRLDNHPGKGATFFLILPIRMIPAPLMQY
jgi:two-component system C4-dicarboxylate transport sensor histidine kinase DctB